MEIRPARARKQIPYSLFFFQIEVLKRDMNYSIEGNNLDLMGINKQLFSMISYLYEI